MRIAFIGTRGVPAHYSGYETFVEQLGARLVDRGHEVTVYARRHHQPRRERLYRGMRVVYVPGIATKHLDTITHTFMSCLHALCGRFDVVLICISGNSPLALVPRLLGIPVVLNVDGSDWRRRKWGRLARTYIRASEWLAVHLPSVTVTDSLVMQQYYRERFGAETECITYGSELPEPAGQETLKQWGLTSRRYLLLVGRLVPENCVHHLVEAYERLDTDLDCVVVGYAPYQASYITELRRLGPRVKFTGYLFGDGYHELLHHAFAVVLCTEVGGTHPVLVEAMAAGNCVVVNDTPTNLEVIDGAGIPYAGCRGADGLLEVLRPLVADERQAEPFRVAARRRAAAAYSWSHVTDQYEGLFRRLIAGGRARRKLERAAETVEG